MVLKSIINTLEGKKGAVEKPGSDVKSGELLGTLCDVLSSRLQQDFTATTQNLKQIINIE